MDGVVFGALLNAAISDKSKARTGAMESAKNRATNEARAKGL
jgi:hypothetical protein